MRQGIFPGIDQRSWQYELGDTVAEQEAEESSKADKGDYYNNPSVIELISSRLILYISSFPPSFELSFAEVGSNRDFTPVPSLPSPSVMSDELSVPPVQPLPGEFSRYAEGLGTTLCTFAEMGEGIR